MSALDSWIKSLPSKDQTFIAETVKEIWELLEELKIKDYLRASIMSSERKDFVEILRTSDGLVNAFNMLFNVPSASGQFVAGRNRQFIEHNKEYGFNEPNYIYLLLNESMSVFLRNVELFRASMLFVLETKSRREARKNRYPFWHNMGIGDLLINLTQVCGDKGDKIKSKIDWELRNCLSHGLIWQDGLNICYSKDITLEKSKRGKIQLDDLWKKAREQSKVTQCLVKAIPEWYS
jgi:hypothetical protein